MFMVKEEYIMKTLVRNFGVIVIGMVVLSGMQ